MKRLIVRVADGTSTLLATEDMEQVDAARDARS